jgi:hypothetical protein
MLAVLSLSLRATVHLKRGGRAADSWQMRSMIGLCAVVGMTIGGFVPELWGASSLSLSSFAFSAAGGVAGIWLGARLVES